jgi:hypothetical protein
MPKPPTGEADLRRLAERFQRAEGYILGTLSTAVTGDRRQATTRALEVLAALRLLDLKAPVVTAYLTEHPKGRPDAVRDLAGSLAKRLDQGARTAADGVHEAFAHVTKDNLDEMLTSAVTAAVDQRGNRWSLGRWATMQTQTLGRQATSRGLTDSLGDGGLVTINTGTCSWCRSHGGDVIIGESPLPPYHPSCSCTASRA